MKQIILQNIRWLFPLILMGVITYISGTPGPNLGPINFIAMDKVGHFCVFGALGVAFARCLEMGNRREQIRAWGLAVLLTVLFGLGDELHQFTNPDRQFEWNDLLADTLGAAFFAGLYTQVGWIRRILEMPVLGKQKGG